MLDFLIKFIDPVLLISVFAGALLVASLQNGFAGLRRGFAALIPCFIAKPDLDRDAARAAMLAVDHLAGLRGLACTDRVRTTQPFLSQAVNKLANCDTVEQFSTWVERCLADRAERHRRSHAFWIAVSEAAPAIGMAGTILGLVRMFAAMDDPATIGPAMAMAMLTTLYGIILANMICAPIAGRLADISWRELAWQRELADGMIAIAQRESTLLKRRSFRQAAAA